MPLPLDVWLDSDGTPETRNKCCFRVDECCYQPLTKFSSCWDIYLLLSKIFAILLCLVVPIWNFFKIPYYLVPLHLQPATNVTYDAVRCNSTVGVLEYWCHGTEASINAGLWWGYRGDKMVQDPIVFLAMHTTLGVTVLMISSITIFFPALRRTYGYFFFICVLIMTLHCMPACVERIEVPLFIGANIVTLIFSVVGYVTLWNFEKFRPYSERLLLASWILCAGISYGAGVLDLGSLAFNYNFFKSNGFWGGALPRPGAESGHTSYDRCNCQWFGWLFCIAWFAFVWVAALVIEVLRWRGIIKASFWSDKNCLGAKKSLVVPSAAVKNVTVVGEVYTLGST